MDRLIKEWLSAPPTPAHQPFQAESTAATSPASKPSDPVVRLRSGFALSDAQPPQPRRRREPILLADCTLQASHPIG